MSALLVVLLIGAVVRATRLATTDAIFETPRAWLESRLPEKLAYLVRCNWCASVWVGLAVFLFGWYAPDTMALIVSGALTASQLAGWAALVTGLLEMVEGRLLEDEDDDDKLED